METCRIITNYIWKKIPTNQLVVARMNAIAQVGLEPKKKQDPNIKDPMFLDSLNKKTNTGTRKRLEMNSANAGQKEEVIQRNTEKVTRKESESRLSDTTLKFRTNFMYP